MFWNWNIQPPSSDLDEQNDADMFWMGNLGAILWQLDLRKWDRKKTSCIPKKGVSMKIRVSQKPLIYDYEHFPHFQIALSPSFRHIMVDISMSVDPKFLHVPSWEQTLQRHKRFWGVKQEGGTPWGSEFSLKMMIKHCKYQCFMHLEGLKP